jgi:hypothetical protein
MRRRKVLVKVLACLFLLPLSTSFVLAQSAKVQKTGNTYCNTTGEDGCYQKGVAWPNPRFTDNGDGTISDRLTGLFWDQSAHRGGVVSWYQAITFCENLELGAGGCTGRDDWRLPNRFELESLLHLGYDDPALSNTAGTGQHSYGDPFFWVYSEPYWTSTTARLGSGTTRAWAVSMYTGTVIREHKSTPEVATRAWCVRGGN